MKYYKLPFAVWKITGNYLKVSNGISTNTPDNSRNAFIDVFGRIIAVFYQKVNPDEWTIAFNEKYAERLEKHLANYLALSKCKKEETNLKAFLIDEFDAKIEGLRIPETNSTIILSENAPAIEQMDEEGFLKFRLENGISMQGIEFDNDMIMNTDWNNAISFTKGCFLGQEIVTKISHRGHAPRRLERMFFDKEPTEITGEIKSKTYSEKLGKWIAYCSVPNLP